MNKIGNKELARLLVDKFGLDRAASEDFVRLIFDVVNDGLKDDSQAKIKGLGTFKITRVAPRKSVDVNTGEPIIIEGRDKMSFTADVSMRNQVNRPFSQFETVVVNDDVDFEEIDQKYAESMNEIDEQEDMEKEGRKDDTPKEENQSQPMETTEGESPETDDALVEIVEESETVTETTEQPLVVSSTQLAMLNEEETAEDLQEDREETSAQASATSDERQTDDADEDLVVSAAQLAALNGEEEPVVRTEKTVVVDNNDNPEFVRVRKQAMEYREEMVKQHRHIKRLMAVGSFVLLACLCGIAYLATQLQKRDNRIEHLETLNAYEQAMATSQIEKQSAATGLENGQESADSMETVPDVLTDAEQKIGTEKQAQQQVEPEQPVAKEAAAEQPRRSDASTKPHEAKPAEETKKAVTSKATDSQQAKYNNDVRIRTGAYDIVGIDHTVTVLKGQTLFSISKAHLGSGMECYVEAVNDGRTDFKAGEKINIPKLKLKKK